MEAQGLAHPPDLAVQSLGEDDDEGGLVLHDHLAGTGGHLQLIEMHAPAHLVDEAFRQRLVDPHQIFFFMDVGRAQDLIHQVSPVRHEHESFRILVQPPDRIDPGRIIHHVHDIRGPVIVRSRADDSCRLVHRQQHRLLSRRILQRAHQFFLHRHLHARLHQRAQLRADAVHLHFSFFDQAVRLSPRAVSHGAEELVDPHRAVIPVCHKTPISVGFIILAARDAERPGRIFAPSNSECFAFLVLRRPRRFASWPFSHPQTRNASHSSFRAARDASRPGRPAQIRKRRPESKLSGLLLRICAGC